MFFSLDKKAGAKHVYINEKKRLQKEKDLNEKCEQKPIEVNQ